MFEDERLIQKIALFALQEARQSVKIARRVRKQIRARLPKQAQHFR